MKYLDHPNTELRLAAVAVVAAHWAPTEYFVSRCLDLAFLDPDDRVRGAAFMAIVRNKQFVDDPTGYLDGLCRNLFPPLPNDARHRAEELLGKARKLKSQVETINLTHAKTLSGTHFENLLSGPSAVATYLSNADPNLRLAAILVIGLYWTKEKSLTSPIERLAFSDSHEEVRFRALDAVIAIYAHSNDKRIGNELAKIVDDGKLQVRLRALAYWGLFVLRGVSLAEQPQHPLLGFEWFSELDRGFVDSFRSDDSENDMH
jgi:hypothetical protein